ncbi:hypothetical protein G9A89_022315 [Geosiphon pyriformis]|nr:hypothetical protein G9A89_022315 [Geosiphon pyriformis]
MTDFGLSGDYKVHNGLDQGEIFYDPLLCEVKRHEQLCEIKGGGGLTLYFSAGIFVNDTIWIGNCQASTQYALNIASEFFMINDISINSKKTVAIPINQGVKVAKLNICGQPILIAKKNEAYHYLGIFLSTEGLSKPSVAKAYADVCFFVNVVLKKAITDKQYSYLVSAILQPIVSYCIQFSFVSFNVCCKWDALVRKGLRSKACLPHDFSDAALHYPLLYSLKPFEQVQFEEKMAALIMFFNASGVLGCLLRVNPVNNFLAGLVKIFLDNGLSLMNNLLTAFRSPGHFPMSAILEKSLYFDLVISLRHFVSSEFLRGKGFLSSGLADPIELLGLDILEFGKFSVVRDGLHNIKQHSKNNFKVATTPDTTTLEYYQSIYTHCKQRFNISDGIEVIKKSVYQYIENCINNYLFGNYNISEVRSNLYNNLVHYLQLGTEDLNSETLATYFQKLNFNIIKYCEKTYPVQSQYSIDFESKTETSNKGKQKLKQYSRTTSNTPILLTTTAKHLQTPEQRTSVKLPLSITLFLISFIQPQTPSLLLKRFSRPEDYQLPRNPTQQQKPISTSANIIDYLQENESNHSKSLESKETESEQEESIDSENKENKMTAYIARIPEFNGEDIETRTVGKWFENLTTPFDDWTAFKTVFLEQFIDNNTSITLQNCFQNIKQEPSKSVHPHAPKNLNSAIQHAKRYEMAMEEANCTKLVNLAIEKTSSAAEEKIDQLTKKDFYHTALSESRATVQQQNSSKNNTTILPARIAENANLFDIFSFEFEAN